MKFYISPFTASTFKIHLYSTRSKPTWNSSQTNLFITNPTLLAVESCNSMAHLKQIQSQMTRTGIIFHVFPISRILTFCALSDTGDLNYAHRLFNHFPNPNVYMWNIMIRGYLKLQLHVKGLSLFRLMVRKCVEMDRRSFVFGLKACEGLLAGESVHSLVWKVGFECDLVVQNGLVHFYGERGRLDSARKVFDESCVRDVVSWTSLINGYVKQGMSDEALRVFELMEASGVQPNEITMITVFSACSQKGDLELGRSLHDYVKRMNLNSSLNLMNSILDMYVKCCSLVTAQEIFENMRTRDVFSWTSLINGYAKNGELVLAKKLFDEMPERNIVSWNAMIAGYSQNNKPKEAIELFYAMENASLIPIETTLICVLSACAQSGCLDLGQWIYFHYIKRNQIQLTVTLGNAFIDMYAKCGHIDAAAELFNGMQEKDLVSWNSMIVGFASHGQAMKSLNLFEQIIEIGYKPDKITFIGVLSACSHGGLLTQGRTYFKEMENIYGLKPTVEHYACMIDLLGRNGLLDEAYGSIVEMPMEADKAVWGAVLSACRMHGNVELGKLATEKLLILDPNDSGIYVLMESLCAMRQKWDEVKMVRSMMRGKGVKKTPGCSCIKVEGEFHEFLVADNSHPESETIYKVLGELISLSRVEDTSGVNCIVENEVHIL
ncbi:pentatricopeptide repeat-containing protein At2g22410, mitochondrial-like [Cynara cardunculus var. scolymus]|uniref:Pentatricopeptide repeat-containing protein n=1 Tax=Cynara cardunculus var. scolymus TaxID=59895 RepID=A0A103XWV8_CYNCS|nr:pentatricopeptide repeat-containing protein At2g22410, mitochondrial-like [Cynara cardunculus var. scolymus]KVH98353.1 Pentatricopeptide repeat-containing protein [Cynara cardunculus var. scolymus]